MKKILSTLLCAAMLFTTLAAAPANGPGPLCDNCLERGCTEAGHAESCICEKCAKSTEEDAGAPSGDSSSGKSDEGGAEAPGEKPAGGTDQKTESGEPGSSETETEEGKNAVKGANTLEANGDLSPVDEPAGTGSFTVSGGAENDYEYDPSLGVLTIKSGTVSVSGSGSSLVIEGGTVTVSGLTITAPGGAAITVKGGSLTIGGPVSLSGTPAIDSSASFDSSFTHLTYGNSEPIEWTGNSADINWRLYSTVQVQDMKVNSLAVTPNEATAEKGQTLAFKAMLKVTAGGKDVELDVTKDAAWSLTGSDTGSAISGGTLTVSDTEASSTLTVTAEYTVNSEKYSGTAAVTLRLPATGVTLNKDKLTLGVGDSAKLKATVTPEGDTGTLKWSVSPKGIVSVDQKGNITALAKGEATVTVTVNGHTAKCAVTVVAKKYTVTFDPDGGACSTKTATTKDDGTLGSLPTATKENLYFAGWYTAKNGKGTRVFANTVLDDDTTLYARWSTVPVTGDENNAVVWASLLAVSALAICAGGVYFFRKGRKGTDRNKGE